MEYPQGLNRDANRIPTTGIGQTRNGTDEFINLVALYEYDKDTNLYFPPGILPNPSAPRVDIADQTVVSSIKAAATTAATLATEATVNAILDKLGAVGIDPANNTVSFDGSLSVSQLSIKGNIGISQISTMYVRDMGHNTEWVLLDTQSPTVIDYIEFASNNNQWANLRLWPYVSGATTDKLAVVKSDGSSYVGLSVGNILENGSGLFDILEYDTANNKYKMCLNRPLYFPEGVYATVRNTSTTDTYNVAMMLLGRKYA